MDKINKTLHLKGCSLFTPSKYPAIEENKTLIAKPALVISLKSRNIDFNEIVFLVVLNSMIV